MTIQTRVTIDNLTGFRRYAQRETKSGVTPAHYTLTGTDERGNDIGVTVNDTESFEERVGVPFDAQLEAMIERHEAAAAELKTALRTVRGRMAANRELIDFPETEAASDAGTGDATTEQTEEITV